MEDLERELLLISKGDELAFNSFMNRYLKCGNYVVRFWKLPVCRVG